MRARLGVIVLVAAAIGLTLPVGASAHDPGHSRIAASLFTVPLASPLATSSDARYVTGDNGVTGGHVAFEGDRLYLGSYGRGMRIYDISEGDDPQLIGSYTPGVRADAPPDAMRYGSREIAVLNGTRRTHQALPSQVRTDRTEWLDVTDPARPVLLHTFGPDQVDGESHNGDIVDERRLYLPSGGVGVQGLRIYDLRPLLDTPASSCRNGAADNPCAPVNIFRGDPAKLWEDSPHRDGRPVGAAFTHTHDITVYPRLRVGGARRDIALLAEGGTYAGNGDTGSVFVIDITKPRKPVVLLRWLHERGAGHHPIRYHHEAQLLDGDPRVMLVADEDLHNGCGGAGGVVALRLNDRMTSARELSEWFIPVGTPAPVCSVHVFTSKGDLAFFGSYNAGLQVVDYSDPSRPRRVDQYIAEGTTAWGAYYRGGLIYMGDMSRGLDVLRYDP